MTHLIEDHPELFVKPAAAEVKPEIISPENLNPGEFRPYRKTAPTVARLLTEIDEIRLSGVVKTMEGDSKFKAGDYLARGPKGEDYPISADFMAKNKRKTKDLPAGWAEFESTVSVPAKKMDHAFGIIRKDGSVHQGKAGDYLVMFTDGLGIIDAEIFAQTYTPVEEKSTEQLEQAA